MPASSAQTETEKLTSPVPVTVTLVLPDVVSKMSLIFPSVPMRQGASQ